LFLTEGKEKRKKKKRKKDSIELKKSLSSLVPTVSEREMGNGLQDYYNGSGCPQL
jgi:hypothetical protein